MKRKSTHVGINVFLLMNLAAVSFYLGWSAVPRSAAKSKAPLRYKVPAVILNTTLHNKTNTSNGHFNVVMPTSTHSQTRSRPWIILATTNKAFLDFTENWLESLKRSNIMDHVTIIAEDNSTYKALKKRNDIKLEIFLTSKTNLPTKDLPFGSQAYLRLVNKRPSYILPYLKKGTDVLFSDVDTVWLKNPLPFMEGDYDIHLGRDIYGDLEKPDLFCAGFVYYSATNATIDLIVKWIGRIHATPKIPDQILLNHLLRNKTIRNTLHVNYLDQRQFPNGNDFFNAEWRKKHANIEPIVVHNNWIKGHAIKIERFKNMSLWYL